MSASDGDDESCVVDGDDDDENVSANVEAGVCAAHHVVVPSMRRPRRHQWQYLLRILHQIQFHFRFRPAQHLMLYHGQRWHIDYCYYCYCYYYCCYCYCYD